jgi:hypothetical protein
MPNELIDNIETSLLLQVPPLFVDDNEEVLPTQIEVGPEMMAGSFLLMVIVVLLSEAQFWPLVNLNVAVPSDKAVTNPALSMDAISGLLLDHTPPVLGERVVVLFIHIAEGPVKLIIGLGLIVNDKDGSETQFVVLFVNVKNAVPALIPVTTPALFIAAMLLLLLTQVPPVVGESADVDP